MTRERPRWLSNAGYVALIRRLKNRWLRAKRQHVALPARAPLLASAKFETRAPDAANAIDIFAGHWAVDLSKINPAWHGGSMDLAGDDRPELAARHLGHAGRFDEMRLLELGPLEATHTLSACKTWRPDCCH